MSSVKGSTITFKKFAHSPNNNNNNINTVKSILMLMVLLNNFLAPTGAQEEAMSCVRDIIQKNIENEF